MREFAFEQALCAHLEAETVHGTIVSRQLGASPHGSRIVDILQVTPGPEFDERVALTPERIPAAAVESDVGPGDARYWKEAFDCHPERARRAVERAVEVGFFEPERRNGRTYVRQSVRYPDWFGRLRGIENKPDLDRPGDLGLQLRRDAALGLLDEAVLATASHVTRAHLNRIPEEIGVWRFDPDTGTRDVVREAQPLEPDRAGIELLERRVARADVRVVTASEKARHRRRLAERAYGKGWRITASEFPACERVQGGDVADHPGEVEDEPSHGRSDPAQGGGERGDVGGLRAVPYCSWKGRIVHPAEECGSDCPGHDPGERPDVDPVTERARRTAWDPDPPGRDRRQARLDRFCR